MESISSFLPSDLVPNSYPYYLIILFNAKNQHNLNSHTASSVLWNTIYGIADSRSLAPAARGIASRKYPFVRSEGCSFRLAGACLEMARTRLSNE
jgi:hypothetical protein